MTMTFEDFYKLAEYGNENWKGSFTPMEIACNAYDYKMEYDYSREHNKPTRTMIELCKLLLLDMDFQDYTDNRPARQSIYKLITNPSVIAIENENNVPISTYSVN